MMKGRKPDHSDRVHAQGVAVGAGFLLIFIFGLILRANAQIEIGRPLHLSHVHGIVTNGTGKPVAKAEITLLSEGVVAFKTKTDDSGRFALDKASGQYRFRVSASGWSPASHDVIIGADIVTLFHKAEVYVMLEPAGCSDECSRIYTSKKNFDEAVRSNTGHYN